MLCSECKINEATVRVVTDINGIKSERYLCEGCARKLQAAAAALKLADALSPFAGFSAEEPRRDKSCKFCGTKLSEFNASGFVGCENCYREFEPSMQQVISRVQLGDRHRGKFPKKCGDYALRTEYDRLGDELKRAKDEDRFEEAMKIHARMLEIRRKLEKPQ